MFLSTQRSDLINLPEVVKGRANEKVSKLGERKIILRDIASVLIAAVNVK